MDKYMEIAYKEALSGLTAKHGGPFGALIIKDNQIISQGHNEVLLRHDPTAHAEIVAIRKACKHLQTVNLQSCILYTTSKPCPMCKGAIQWSRIKKVVYSGEYSDTEKLSFDDMLFSDSFNQIEEEWLQIDQEHFYKLVESFESYKTDIRY